MNILKIGNHISYLKDEIKFFMFDLIPKSIIKKTKKPIFSCLISSSRVKIFLSTSFEFPPIKNGFKVISQPKNIAKYSSTSQSDFLNRQIHRLS